jgi:hypothetical protein
MNIADFFRNELENKGIEHINVVFTDNYQRQFTDKIIKKPLHFALRVALYNSLNMRDNDRGPVWICSCIRSN